MRTFVSAEETAHIYFRKMRNAALKEVEHKLAQFKSATVQTVRYWLLVHTAIEKKITMAERKMNK